MAIKPTDLPEWASANQVDPISGINNVIEPPAEKKTNGWDRLEYPPRNWFNWLFRLSYNWLDWLKQQEEQKVVTDGNGALLFPTDEALIVYYAIDIVDPTHYLHAVGFKTAATNAALTVITNDTLTLNTGAFTTTGTAPLTAATVTGSDLSNAIIYASTSIIP